MDENSIDVEIIDTVENSINNIFSTLSNMYKLTSGDMSPEQISELEIIQEQLIGIAEQYVNNNKEQRQ